MKTMVKRLSAVIMILVLATVMCGCENSKSDVKLKTADEAKEYVEENLPKAKYLSREEISDNEAAYHFKDELCGFEFTVTSEKENVDFDAVAVGYKEKTSDNWDKAYYSYLQESVSDVTDRLKKGLWL